MALIVLTNALTTSNIQIQINRVIDLFSNCTFHVKQFDSKSNSVLITHTHTHNVSLDTPYFTIYQLRHQAINHLFLYTHGSSVISGSIVLS